MAFQTRSLLTAALATIACIGVSHASTVEPGGPGESAQARRILEQTPDIQQSTEAILIRFRADATPAARAAVRSSLGGATLRSYSLIPDLELVSTPGGVGKALVSLANNPSVAYAEPDFVIRTCTTPNDPGYAQMWGLNNSTNFDINAPEAWDIFTGDPNFVVADIDTGIQLDHPDLSPNIWTNTNEVVNGVDDDGNGYVDDVKGWNFYDHNNSPSDYSGHGTHTAGTIGAIGNNAVGTVGVCWRCKIMPLRFIGPSGGFESDAIAAVQYAVRNGARLSNNSWGSNNFMYGLYDAINAARQSGHLFVAAAGNAGLNTDQLPFYPGSFDLDNIVTVGAIDRTGNLAMFSNYSITGVDIAAPGDDVYSTYVGSSFANMSGTSMATPHVTGTAALLWGRNPGWSYQQIRDRLFTTCRPMGDLAGRIKYGGVVNAYAAIQGTGGNNPPQVQILTPTSGGTTTEDSWIYLSDSAMDPQEGDLSARTVWTSSIQGYLGTGSGVWRTGLVPGTHTITATVRDSGGATGTASVIVVSIPDKVLPGSYSLARGIYVGGQLSDVFNSDDSRFVARPGAVLSFSEAPIQLVLNGVAATSNPSSLKFTLEAQVNSANLQQKLEMFNFSTGTYEVIDTRSATTTDSSFTITISTNPSRFIDPGTKAVRTRISFKAVGPVLSNQWQARIDQAIWYVFP